jgi:ATP-dependent RNA helicase DeaD
MPAPIRRIAQRHMAEAEEINLAAAKPGVSAIQQRYWVVPGKHKLDAATRLLETEDYDAILVFVRTRSATTELAERFTALGYPAAALNGDMPQDAREQTINKLKNGSLTLLVATDVAARGLDVERISHVFNYDLPGDAETYLHRIGRTGRAGRKGDAILFVAPREKRLLHTIEKATRQPITPMQMPTARDINVQRVLRFKQRVRDALADERNELFYQMLTEVQEDSAAEALEIAAALAHLLQGDEPLLLPEQTPQSKQRAAPDRPPTAAPQRERGARVANQPLPLKGHPEVRMERVRLAVGHQHGVKPGNIVGAIANEADIDSEYIGHIEIHDTFSTIDLPAGMPKETFAALKKTRVCQQRLAIERMGAKASPRETTRRDTKSAREAGPENASQGRGTAAAGQQPKSSKRTARSEQPKRKQRKPGGKPNKRPATGAQRKAPR